MSRFPVTATDTVKPGDPLDEPTRDYLREHPEGYEAFLARTRRYFRLTHLAPSRRYAKMGGPPGGLDTEPDWFA